MKSSRWTTYFVRAVGTGLVKIGHTTDPDVAGYVRRKQTFCPVDLILLGVPNVVERELQDRFEIHWKRGEWYRETGDLADYIAVEFPEAGWRKIPPPIPSIRGTYPAQRPDRHWRLDWVWEDRVIW